MKKKLISALFIATSIGVAHSSIIKQIQIEGVEPTLAAEVRARLPVKEGDNLSQTNLSQIVRSLYQDPRFEQVDAYQSEGNLTIKLQPKTYIADVVVTGSKKIPVDAIKDNLRLNGISSGELLNKDKLEAFKQELISHYHSLGHNNVSISTDLLEQGKGVAKLQVTIDENANSLVKQTRFNGNNAFSHKRLLSEMSIKPDAKWWQLFSSSRFSEQKLEQDISALRNFYFEQGYAKFQVLDVDTQLSEDKKDVNIEITIDEGQKYTFSGIDFVGDLSFLEDKKQDIIGDFKDGMPFKGSVVARIENNIKSVLAEQGFANPKVVMHTEFNDSEQQVKVIAIVEPGQRYYVRALNFQGNNVTRDKTLRQEMRQMEGTWLSSELLSQGKLRLERTGFFESVEVETLPVANSNDTVDVLYKVKERNTGSINVGVGYGSESGVSYQAGIKQDNFLGMGSSISLSGAKNKYSNDINLSYSEPYFTRDGVGLSVSAFYNDYDSSKSDVSSSFSKTSYGLNSSLNVPVNENNAYYVGLGYTHNKLKNLRPEYTRGMYLDSMNINHWDVKTDDFDLNIGWNYNSLNRGFFPTSGSSFSIAGKVMLPGSDNQYYQLSSSYAGYLPLNDAQNWGLSARARASYISGFGDKEVPFYNLYSAGGIGSLRGFAYGAIGPKAVYASKNSAKPIDSMIIDKYQGSYDLLSNDVVGGDVIVNGSLELIMPVPFVKSQNQINVRNVVFIDAATVWNTKWREQGFDYYHSQGLADYSGPRNVRVSMGVGFQWNSPVGPLLFSYARPLKKYEGDVLEAFQFSIGGSF